MNIVKLQNDLKNVPDQALIGYVQNPTGQVPSYLALSELQRRKEMREKYQAAQPEKTTVAEDLEQQAQPVGPATLAKNPQPGAPTAQGVAGLSVPDEMFSGQGMAAGGIVAFADGGQADVDSLNLDVQPTLNVNTGQSTYGIPDNMNANQWVAYGGLRGAIADQARRGVNDAKALNWMFGLGQKGNTMYDQFANQARSRLAEGGEVKGYAGPEGSYVYSSDYDPVEQYRRARQLGAENVMAKRYGMPTTSVTSAGVETPYDAALNYYEGLRQQAAVSGKGLPELKSATDSLQKRREAWLSGSLDPYSQASPVGSKPNVLGTQPPVVPVAKPSDQPDVRLTGDAAPDTAKQPIQGVGFDASFYDKMLTKERALKDIAQEYKDALGTDPTLATRQARLKAMEDRAAKMEERAPWMSLVEAGLGMASGTSPFALENIGKGALMGVKSYNAAQDKLADLEEKRFTLDNELSKQQRAEQIAAVTYGVNSRQHTEEMNKTIMLAKAKDKLTRDVANLEAGVNLATKAAANAPKVKDIAEARANYQGSTAQKETIKQLLKVYGDNADKPTSPRNAEFVRDLKIAEENYLANYFSPIGSNIPKVSTQGFEITNPKK